MNLQFALRDKRVIVAIMIVVILIWGLADGTLLSPYGWFAMGWLLACWLVILRFPNPGTKLLWWLSGTGAALIFFSPFWLLGAMLFPPAGSTNWKAGVMLVPSGIMFIGGTLILAFAGAMACSKFYRTTLPKDYQQDQSPN